MSNLRIMFVCTGNICRSPLAHAVFEHKAREAGLDGGLEVESSGTGAWHVGELPDPRMRSTAAKHGVRMDHRSRQLSREDIAEYDLVLVMDGDNRRDALSLCGNEGERSKIRMFRDFDPSGSGDVPDPWYGGQDGFDRVWSIVERTCDALLEEIGNGAKIA